MESGVTSGQRASFSSSGTVFVQNTRSMGLALTRSMAGPDSTGCTHPAKMRRTPASRSAMTVLISVPAVSMMSSTTTTLRSLTSPMTCRTSTSFFPFRRLSTIARPAPRRFANARARSTPPASGETTVSGCREEMVHGDFEEALDLRGMEVDAEDAVGTRRHDEVGDELRGDRDTRFVLAVLPRVAVVREHGGHARRRGALECVEHDEELHDVVVRRRARGLHDEHVRAPDVLLDLAVILAVGEIVERGARRERKTP